jgi:transcriptional regulator with XRE-family HTH domain
LARRCSLTQRYISYIEAGQRRTTLSQLLRIARALDVSVQRLLAGSDRPGEDLKDLAVELRRLGVNDLWVRGETVPGAFRRPEEVIALAVSGREPDPRVVEAIPAALAWNEINPTLLRAYGVVTRTVFRLAWLADVALAIERHRGFPGGCRKGPLERFVKVADALKRVRGRAAERTTWDDLGRPSVSPPASPVWKRWKISYGAGLDGFEARAPPRQAPSSGGGRTNRRRPRGPPEAPQGYEKGR